MKSNKPLPSLKAFESSLLIKSHLNRWTQLNEGLTIREWSKLMGLSHSYLSLILSSKRLASTQIIDQIASALDLDSWSIKNLKDARERDWVLQKGIKFSTPAATHSTVMTTTQPLNKSDSALYAEEVLDGSVLLKSWIHMAFLDFTTCDGFSSDLHTIASYFDLSPSTMKQVIEDLMSHGFLIKNSDGSYTKTSKNLRVTTPRSSKAIRAFHIAMMKKASNSLEKSTDPHAPSKRLLNSYTVAVDESQLPEVFEMINQSFSQVIDKLKTGVCTTVYQVQFQIMPLLKPSKIKK